MSLWDELNLLGKTVALCLVALFFFGIGFALLRLMPVSKVSYVQEAAVASASSTVQIAVTHLKTPSPLKGIYITACTAGTKHLREKILKTMEGTPINALVIDIKDYTGTLAYEFPNVQAPKGRGCRISDLPQFISQLHEKKIYAIARVTVFQDPLYASVHPDLAVQSASNPGRPWKDRNGLAFIDPNVFTYWKYIVDIARAAYATGFDEINFDYIRFPSDGDMADARFVTPAGLSKSDVMLSFFQYLHAELGSSGIVTSADLFGQTTVNRDDMGIGQILEHALPYFDYVMPMNYPSHYIKGFMGYDNPAEKPYEIIKVTMLRAVERTVAATSSVEKLRPWLQAFDLGAVYTPDMIKAQVRGAEEAGVKSWVLWDASNRYKKESLE